MKRKSFMYTFLKTPKEKESKQIQGQRGKRSQLFNKHPVPWKNLTEPDDKNSLGVASDFFLDLPGLKDALSFLKHTRNEDNEYNRERKQSIKQTNKSTRWR